MTLAPASFDYVRTLVQREAAIVLEPGKEYLVESRLLPLAREAGVGTVAAYIDGLRQRPDLRAQARVVDALTTNETSWFRDGDPYAAVSGTILPALAAARADRRVLRIWSAACSSGQEPYSLAMLVLDCPQLAGWRVEILGTDISDEMLARAAAGRFSQLEVNRGLPAPMLVRHFRREGTEWVLDERVRRMVTFRKLNLAAPLPPLGSFDLVMVRNVLIYFDVATKRSILRRVRTLTAPGGYLVLGAAETTLGVEDAWQRDAVGRCSIHRPRTGG